MRLIIERVRFNPNTHESGRIFVKQLHPTFIQYINPWWIKFFSHVHVPCFFHLAYVEEPIIILNTLSICLTEWREDNFKPHPWHILMKSERHTLWHCRLHCWPPVPPVGDSDPATHVEPTSKLPDKLSKVYWMFNKIIIFGDEYLF